MSLESPHILYNNNKSIVPYNKQLKKSLNDFFKGKYYNYISSTSSYSHINDKGEYITINYKYKNENGKKVKHYSGYKTYKNINGEMIKKSLTEDELKRYITYIH